jgi:hypothetical protein
MQTFTRQYGQVLIIFLTTLFIGGGASLAVGQLLTGMTLKDLERQITLHVSDPARQKSSLILLEQWKDEGKALQKEYKEQRDKLLDLLEKHDARQSEFDAAIYDTISKGRLESQRFLDIQFELRQHINADEWNKIFSTNQNQTTNHKGAKI